MEIISGQPMKKLESAQPKTKFQMLGNLGKYLSCVMTLLTVVRYHFQVFRAREIETCQHWSGRFLQFKHKTNIGICMDTYIEISNPKGK